MKQFILLFWFFAPLFAAAQDRAAYSPILPGQPGQYDLANRSVITKNRIDWKILAQKTDQAAYETATREADEAYVKLFGQCVKQEASSCTGLMLLKQLHIETVISTNRVATALEINKATQSFLTDKQTFKNKLASLRVLRDVWYALSSQPIAHNNSPQVAEYQKGHLNLKALDSIYTEGFDRITKEATALTYRVETKNSVVETKPGAGIERSDQHLVLSSDRKASLSEFSMQIARHTRAFIGASDLKAFWSGLHEGGQKDWIQTLLSKAKSTSFARGLYCTPVGVPALEIIGQLKEFDDLRRGAHRLIQIQPKLLFDVATIRSNIDKFDQLFGSLNSSGNTFEGVGGVTGFLHRVNPVLQWNDEILAFLSALKVLRDMHQDELDLLTDTSFGCAKVRSRYIERYQSTR